jgi:hypothetical protein
MIAKQDRTSPQYQVWRNEVHARFFEANPSAEAAWVAIFSDNHEGQKP